MTCTARVHLRTFHMEHYSYAILYTSNRLTNFNDRYAAGIAVTPLLGTW